MRESILFVVNAALTATLFVLDIQTPLGFTNHTLYATVIVISAASQFPWIPSLTAGIGTICTIIGYFYSPHSLNIPQWIPVGNRLFTITILWTLVWFIRQRRSAEITLQNTNELLERKVEDRTRNLRETNQAMASEIEVRKRAEEAYRSTEDRLAGILDIAEDAIIVADSSRTITLFNQGAVKLFGYTSVEVLGQSLDRLLPERFRKTHSQHIDTFAHSTESSRLLAQRREVFGLKKDGTEFPAEASISKLTVGASNTFTVILRDISARLRTESQLRSLTTQLITVQEQERSRISRELHDDINQRLAMLAIEMDRAAIHPHASSDSLQQAVQAFAKQLAKISDDVRRIAYNFHPSILDDLGLPAAIKHLTNAVSAQTGIKIIVVQEELDASLTQEITSCLYRIAQESLSNIVKHAQASRVELELTCDDQEITLRVHDNGLGFDLEKVRSNHFGLGLVNMYERVRSARGQLSILTNPESGTNIIVQIPLPGAQHDLPAGPLS